jgi:alcohol dehydrogenase (cytochrome c)
MYYVQTLESCAVYVKRPATWAAGRGFWGGSTRQAPNDAPKKILRAYDIQTGKTVWELPQEGTGGSWGGALSTGGGLVFFGEDSGDFMAADAKTGKPLWRFPTNHLWRASPITYMFDGKQYVAVAAGPNILSFAVPGN